ncbi:MAG: hypothetical protein AB7O38_02095 [Pirellulaceae bacterium]
MNETPNVRPGIRLSREHFVIERPVNVGVRLQLDALFARGVNRLVPAVPPIEDIGFYFNADCSEDEAIDSTMKFLEWVAAYVQPSDRE